MDDFTLQIKTVCLVSILTGIMGALIPSGRLKKSFDSFCAVVIVAAILLPVNSLKNSAAKDISFDFSKSENNLLNQEDTAEKLIYKEVLEKALNGRISQIAPTSDVKVECVKNDSGYEIKSFTVSGCTSAEKEAVAAYFKESFSGIPVYFKEEQNGRIEKSVQ